MKKLVFLSCLLLAFSSTYALALTTAEVGGFDTYRDYRNENLNEAGDMAWFAQVFGLDVNTLVYGKLEPGTWLATTNDASAIYFDFSQFNDAALADPLGFIVKSGAPGAFTFNDGINGPFVANNILFQNNATTRYGLIDLDWFNATNGNFTIGSISHTSVVGGDPIPEPSTFILLGAGLLSLVALRRKKC
jgi:hypothetical protein